MGKKTAPRRVFFGEGLKKTEAGNYVMLLGLLLVSCTIMFYDYLFGNQLMIFNDIGSDTWQQEIKKYLII